MRPAGWSRDGVASGLLVTDSGRCTISTDPTTSLRNRRRLTASVPRSRYTPVPGLRGSRGCATAPSRADERTSRWCGRADQERECPDGQVRDTAFGTADIAVI